MSALQLGDPYPCPRCHQVHVVERPFADRTTAEQLHLYVTCRGQQYFVGQLCARCQGARWIREEHPDRPYPHDACDGPGVPCPGCNRDAQPALPPAWTSA